MSIVVTSGGTRIPIDDVRYIGNFSKGNFGAKIVKAFLPRTRGETGGLAPPYGTKVYHIRAKEAVAVKGSDMWGNFLNELVYETYQDYYRTVKYLLENEHVDLFFAAAAVSDYGLDAQPGKISSDEEEIVLRLKRLPKVLPLLKGWAAEKSPDMVQVGFKLLSQVCAHDLLLAAIEAGKKAQSEFTIANNLPGFKLGSHDILLYDHLTNTFSEMPVNTQKQVNEMVSKILSASGLAKKWNL